MAAVPVPGLRPAVKHISHPGFYSLVFCVPSPTAAGRSAKLFAINHSALYHSLAIAKIHPFFAPLPALLSATSHIPKPCGALAGRRAV